MTDIPAACFAPELIAAYPEAKVILSNRDIDAWHKYVHVSYIDNPPRRRRQKKQTNFSLTLPDP